MATYLVYGCPGLAGLFIHWAGPGLYFSIQSSGPDRAGSNFFGPGRAWYFWPVQSSISSLHLDWSPCLLLTVTICQKHNYSWIVFFSNCFYILKIHF